jgi:hypothetical protein
MLLLQNVVEGIRDLGSSWRWLCVAQPVSNTTIIRLTFEKASNNGDSKGLYSTHHESQACIVVLPLAQINRKDFGNFR